MAAIDFPNVPVMDQEFTAMGIIYKWNGTGWTIKGSSSAALIDAYTKAESDARFVNVTSDIMTGDLKFTG